jgi:hypothetical protein
VLSVGVASGETIEDQSGNAMTNFTPATNLADNKAIVIDTMEEEEEEEEEREEENEEDLEEEENNEEIFEIDLSDEEMGVQIKYSPEDDSEKKETMQEEETRRFSTQKMRFGGNTESIAGGSVVMVDVKNDDELFTETVNPDGTWKRNWDFDEDGIQVVRFRFFDENGNRVASSKRYKFDIRTEAPVFTYLPETLRKQPTDLVWWIAEDEDGIEKYRYTFNGKTKETNLNHFYLPPDIAVGEYELVVSAYDTYGNVSKVKSVVLIGSTSEEFMRGDDESSLEESENEGQKEVVDYVLEDDENKRDESGETGQKAYSSTSRETMNAPLDVELPNEDEASSCSVRWWNPFSWFFCRS